MNAKKFIKIYEREIKEHRDDYYKNILINNNKTTHSYRSHGATGSENFGNFEKMFVAKGVQKSGRLGNAEVKICDAKRCTEVLLELYAKTKENLCLNVGDISEELYKD